MKTAPAKKPVAKKVTGCEEGFKLVKGKLQAHHRDGEPQGCPAGTKPVPETDNCVPLTSTSKSGCAKGQIRIEGRCIAKQDAASFCGPGFRLQGNKCAQGFVAPKPQKKLPTWQIEAIAKGFGRVRVGTRKRDATRTIEWTSCAASRRARASSSPSHSRRNRRPPP